VQIQAAIAEAGGVKALVDLIFKWSITGGEGVLVCALARHVHMHVIPMPCILTCYFYANYNVKMEVISSCFC